MEAGNIGIVIQWILAVMLIALIALKYDGYVTSPLFMAISIFCYWAIAWDASLLLALTGVVALLAMTQTKGTVSKKEATVVVLALIAGTDMAFFFMSDGGSISICNAIAPLGIFSSSLTILWDKELEEIA